MSTSIGKVGMKLSISRCFVPLLLLLAMHPASGWAQDQPADPTRSGVSREALLILLERYEQTARSAAYSDEMSRQAGVEAALIRLRLKEGDFQVGDQIALVVEGEQQLTGSFAIQDGPVLVLPGIGEIPMAGVMRSELENHLRNQLSRFIHQPIVHAQSSIRLMMTGGIGKAGYYVLPTSALLSDALMVAGGPVPNARLDRIRVERKGEVIWEGEAVQQAIIEGRTLDRMSIRAGDQVVIPMRGDGLSRLLAPLGLVISTLTVLLQVL